MGEKEMKTLGPSTINKIVTSANEKGIKNEDIVDIVSAPNGFILIYFG